MEGLVKTERTDAEHSATVAADLVAATVGEEEMSFAELLKRGTVIQIVAAMEDTRVVDDLKTRRFDGGKNALHLAFDAFREVCLSGDDSRSERLQVLQQSFPIIFAKFPEMVLEPDAAGFNVFEYSIATRPQVATYTLAKKNEEAKSIANTFVAFYDSMLVAHPTTVIDSNNAKAWGGDVNEETQLLQSLMFLASGEGFCDYTVGAGKVKFPMLKTGISDDFKDKVSASTEAPEAFGYFIRKGYCGLVGSVIGAAARKYKTTGLKNAFDFLRIEIGEVLISDAEVEESVQILMTNLTMPDYYTGFGLSGALGDDFVRSMREGLEDVIVDSKFDDRKKQQFADGLMIIPGLYRECYKRFVDDFNCVVDGKGGVGDRFECYKKVFPGFVGELDKDENLSCAEFVRLTEASKFSKKEARQMQKIKILHPEYVENMAKFREAIEKGEVENAVGIAIRYPRFVTDKVLSSVLTRGDAMHEGLLGIREENDKHLAALEVDRARDGAASSRNPKAVMTPFGSSPTVLQSSNGLVKSAKK